MIFQKPFYLFLSFYRNTHGENFSFFALMLQGVVKGVCGRDCLYGLQGVVTHLKLRVYPNIKRTHFRFKIPSSIEGFTPSWGTRLPFKMSPSVEGLAPKLRDLSSI